MFISLALCFALIVLPSNSAADDRLSPGQSISANRTLVSEGGRFELGFFSPGKSRNYYIGIWYKIVPSKDVIWVANRRVPVSDPSASLLKLTEYGNLVLLDQSNTLVWSSNSTSTPSASNSIAAVLLDTGNLVISSTSDSSGPIWQSFDHPSHAWMPGGWLGLNKLTGQVQSITSWRNSEDPSPGLYTEGIDPNGIDQYVLLYNGSLVYWSTGRWNGQYFSGVPGTKEKSSFNFSFVDNDERKYAIYDVIDRSIITYTLMDPTGQVKQLMWLNSSQRWLPFYNQPLAICDVYSACGDFGICDGKGSPVCSCYKGFEPASKKDWDLGAWSSGCSRRTRLQCKKSNSTAGGQDGDGFFEMQMVRLPSNPQNLTVQSLEECELACRSSCSCAGYAFHDRCSIWNGNLQNVEQFYDGDNGAGTLYLRLATSDLPPPTSNNTENISDSSHNHSATTVILGVVAVVLVSPIVAGLIWACQKRSTMTAKQVAGSLISFTYADLQRMTKNFSEELGRGGFGSVFKGTMADSTLLAVKKLEGLRQGEKQFRTEVSTLGSIQHVNLVRLRGFCCEGRKRLLVYDYMPGGSLDSVLFENSKHLEWSVRYQIMLGIARGLAYLHEKCRECIVHCDIKPDNILLDNDFSPKVADFGLAKLIGRDFSRVLTTIRGTRGYMAPEWAAGLPITPKVDVYSFGMMLFEIISGKRNNGSNEDGSNYVFFPVEVARRLTDNNLSDLLDESLAGEADTVGLNRVCKVACWCIQDSDANRPTMGQIVQILEGAVDVPMPSIPRYIQNLMQEDQGSVYFSLPAATKVVPEGHSSPFYSLPLTEDEQNAS